MKRNLGKADKTIRIILGIILFFTGYLTNYIWMIIGVILLVTGIVNWCPIYKAFGISTWKEG